MQEYLLNLNLLYQQYLDLSPIKPHIFLLPTSTSLVYRCAIALQLGAIHSNNPLLWSEILYNTHLDNQSPFFDLMIHQDGYLDFYPHPLFLANWLKEFPNHWKLLCQDSVIKIDIFSFPRFNPFLCQYVHARCCSWRQLAIEQKVKDHNSLIPWLSAKNYLNISEVREWSLLRQIVLMFDRLQGISASELLKRMTALSQEFLLFEQNCRIFGETLQLRPEISLIRLGLIHYVELILQEILNHWLNLVAPGEL